MNKVFLCGRLTADPELRRTQGGTAVASVTVAVDREVRKEDGAKEADFIPVTVWGKSAENLQTYVGKGGRVLVEGRMQVSSYEKDGQRRYRTEVVASRVEFIDFKERKQQTQPSADIGQEVFLDEDLPFGMVF